MGIIPLFDWGEANALFFMEKFTLINKARLRIKIFEPFEDNLKNSSMVNAILISYGCVFKRSRKPVMKGSRIKSIEEARNEYKKLLEEGWEKLKDSTEKRPIGTLPKI